jgi:hypothetical protein
VSGTGAGFARATGSGFYQGTGAARGYPNAEYGDGLWMTSRYPAPADSAYTDIYKIDYPTDFTSVETSWHSSTYLYMLMVTHDDTDFFFTDFRNPERDWYKMSGQITDTVLDSRLDCGQLYGFNYREYDGVGGYDEISAARDTANYHIDLYEGMTGTVIVSQDMSGTGAMAEVIGAACHTLNDFLWSNTAASPSFHEVLTSGHYTDTVLNSINYEDHLSVAHKPISGFTCDGTDAVMDDPFVAYFYTYSGLCSSQTITNSDSYSGTWNPEYMDWGSYTTRYV